MEITKTELLAPAGSPEALDAAIGEGADAVYLGLKEFNARMRSANFAYSQFEGALRTLHRTGRKIYVTVNTVFEQREADRVYRLLKYLAALGPDGIMVQDFGVATMAREHFPSLKLFASTQMNVASARGANLLSRHGFSRVVLARELSLAEIQDIRANTNLELEVFIHGALCMSVSGICLFSSYLGGKSANRGMCTQACRRYYTAGEESGGYFFSPSDLELVEKIPDLIGAGVNSFKIEGRMKSAEYVGAVVSAYRRVIDSMDAGEDGRRRAIAEAKSILKNDFARSKTIYLLNGLERGETIPAVSGEDPPFSGPEESPGFDWLNPRQSGGTGIPLGNLIRVSSKTGREGENRGLIPSGPFVLSPGDSIRLHRADDSDRVSHKLTSVEDEPDGVWISIPEGFGPGDAVYLIQTKAMTKRYTPVIPRNLDGFNRVPGREKAPLPLPAAAKENSGSTRSGARAKETNSRRSGKTGAKADFPEGFYAMVSRIEDLYILQSSRPVKAILTYSRKTVRQLLAGREKALPFPARDIIISLDPFFPQNRDAELAGDVSALMEKGYTRFIVNNLGHFSLFKRGTVSESVTQKNQTEPEGSARTRRASPPVQDAVLIAGPWLYAFNAWAWDFISGNGTGYCVSPLENNRQNLERTFPREGYPQGNRPRAQVFITIFTRPSLFRIRPDLGKVYDFTDFSGNRDEAFNLVPAPEGTLVYPREPFSIVDKTPFLREAGFTRFILDFSSGPLKKAGYRDIMDAVNRAAPIPGITRFNWKNGFFRGDNELVRQPGRTYGSQLPNKSN